MNAKSKMLVTVLSGISLLAVASGQLFAQGTPGGGSVPMALTITATVTVQGADNGGDPIDKIATGSMKITTAWIIQQIAAAESLSFPKGAKLVLDSGSVSVTDSKGNVLFDASSYVTVDLDPDAMGVWSGQVNNNTSAANYTGTYLTTVTYSDPAGDTITFTGLTSEKYSLTAMDGNGNQNGTDSLTITGVGEGNFSGNNLAGSGTIGASGKGAFGS